MPDAIVLLLPILGGYYFVENAHKYRYKVVRLSGQALYLKSAFYGFALAFIAAVGLILFESIWDTAIWSVNRDLFSLKFKFASDSNSFRDWLADSKSMISVFSMILGGTLPYVLNSLPDAKINALQDALKERDLDLMLLRSQEINEPILYTLSNGKIYLGFTVRGPDPAESRKWVRILPLASGYRDEQTHKLNLTTTYSRIPQLLSQSDSDEYIELTEEQARDGGDQPDAPEQSEDSPSKYGNISLEDMEVILPIDQIHSARIFSPKLYSFFDPKEASKLNS